MTRVHDMYKTTYYEDFILRYIRTCGHPQCTVTQIRTETDLSDAIINWHIDAMVTKGLIEFHNGGWRATT